MSLPQEHVTPKFESLKGGLKERAEKIIKKKFGLNVKTQAGVARASDVMTVEKLKEAYNTAHMMNMDAMTYAVNPSMFMIERYDHGVFMHNFSNEMRKIEGARLRDNDVVNVSLYGRGYSREISMMYDDHGWRGGRSFWATLAEKVEREYRSFFEQSQDYPDIRIQTRSFGF